MLSMHPPLASGEFRSVGTLLAWPNRPQARGAAWLVLVAPGLIWGASFLFIAEGLEAVGPMGVTFLRILIGFATLALFPAAWRPVPRSNWGKVALLGVLWLAFPLSMFPFAEQRVSSALTGMLNGATPIFTAIVAAPVRSPAARTIATSRDAPPLRRADAGLLLPRCTLSPPS